MNKKTIILTSSLFFVLIVGMFAYSYLKKSELQRNEQNDPAQEVDLNDNSSPYDYINRVDATHFYVDGTHSFVGELVMPTPCDLLEAKLVSTGENTYALNFSVINNADTCIQTLTPMRFRADIEAPENVLFSSSFMGKDIVLNIIEAPKDARPEDFELYIKG